MTLDGMDFRNVKFKIFHIIAVSAIQSGKGFSKEVHCYDIS